MGFYHLLVVLLCSLIHSDARPDGAPRSACSSLLPSHRGFSAKHTTPPYRVSAVNQGNRFTVTISSSDGENFQGFMLQARSSNDPDKFIDGTFTVNQMSKAIDCFRGRNNTLTQVNTGSKARITTEWTPNGFVNEDIIFRATVAKSFQDFWTEIDSEPVRIRRSGSSSAPSKNSNRDTMYDDCFLSKGCFGYPIGCAERSDCEFMLSYANSASGIAFSLLGFLEPDTYMAMGLSDDANMGNDRVVECFRDGSRVMARESWNEGKSNGRTRELNDYDSSYSNGLTSCQWTTRYQSDFNGRRYDLQNNYYILLAKGPMKNGKLDYHTERMASRAAVNLTAFEAIAGEGVSAAIKVHGTFMVTAWVGFVSMAILLARHFKNTWENSTLGGVKIWFALHRGFMLTALVFFIIAFIVIFVYKNGWSPPPDGNPHAVLGCIAVALGIFNPIMALFRPAPDHKNRPVFNWLHWGVGNLAHLIAVITIFYAVDLPSSGLKGGRSVYWVMAIFVVVYLIFHLLYHVHTWTQSKKKSNDVGMSEMNGSRTNGHNGQNAQAKNVSDNVFRILLLGIYCIFILIILITLYALIGVAKF